MSRYVCFIDDEDGQQAICLNETSFIKNCKDCKMNPFPNGIVPEDRVLRKTMPESFEYGYLTDSEYKEMIEGRVFHSQHRTRGRYQVLKALHKTSAYAVEYELITAEEWKAMIAGEHRFPRSRKDYPVLRGRGISRLRFSLRNPKRR